MNALCVKVETQNSFDQIFAPDQAYLAWTIELEVRGLLGFYHRVVSPHYHHKELQPCHPFPHRCRFHWSGIVDQWEEAS